MRLSGFVEKPKPADAPSQFGAIGRYVFQCIFEHLKHIKRGSGGEIQLTDAIASLPADQPAQWSKPWAVAMTAAPSSATSKPQ